MSGTGARFATAFGATGPGVQTLIASDPDFAAAFIDYAESAGRASGLPPWVRELLLLAHDVSITNLDEIGATHRVTMALEAGATPAQVVRVVELVTMVSLHGLTHGIRIVQSLDDDPEPEAIDDPRGYWRAFDRTFPAFREGMRAGNPAAYEAYERMGSLLWREGGLEPRWAELVYVVADLANTHLFTDGAAFHIENALHYGATREQVVDAIFLTVPSVVRSLEVGFRAVRAGLDAHGTRDQSSASTPR